LFLTGRGYRCIAHDRRGHGRSAQPARGHDMDTYADDLADLVQALDLTGAVHVGHSTGGGEVARYPARHRAGRCAGAGLIGAVTPGLLKSEANPFGAPIEAFDTIRAGLVEDRAQYFKDFAIPFYGANREGAKVSEGLRAQFLQLGLMGALNAEYECVKAFS